MNQQHLGSIGPAKTMKDLQIITIKPIKVLKVTGGVEYIFNTSALFLFKSLRVHESGGIMGP